MMPKVTPKINSDYTWYKMKIVKSPISRFGVVAEEKIPAKRYVIEYTGVLYNRKQSKKLYKTQPEHKLIYIWNIGWDGYWIIDGLTNGSGAEFINHSCDPNLEVVFQGRRVYYYSRRPIKKGEELTIDYAFEWDEDEIVKCRCGSKKCRGTINDPPRRTRVSSK